MKRDAFSPLTVAAMLGVGLLCFTAFVLLLAFKQGPHSRDGAAHAASRSAVGFAGVAQLLRDTGTAVALSRDPSGGTRVATTGLLVLTPPPEARGPDTMPDLLADAVLIVLPKWRAEALAGKPGWVEARGLLPPAQVLGVLPRDWERPRLTRAEGTATPSLAGGSMFKDLPALSKPVSRLQILDGRGWIVQLRDRDGGALLAQPYEGGPYVLSDPDLLSNQALATLAGADAAASLLRALADGEGVTFDLSRNGLGRPRDLLRLMLVPPFLGATLCAAAAAIMVGLLSLRRFGPALAAPGGPGLGKRALADNAAGLITLAGRESRMARPYAELTRTLAARAAALPRGLGPAETDAHLDRAAALRGLPHGITALLAEAGAVRDRAGLLRHAQRLYDWRTRLHARLHG